jgi:hypothetical protein
MLVMRWLFCKDCLGLYEMVNSIVLNLLSTRYMDRYLMFGGIELLLWY